MQEVDWTNLPGRLIVLSGPSGSGKSTLVQRLLERPGLRLEVSISATTRPPRAGERSGRAYVFLSAPEFENIRDQLLESAEVHGHSYGTPAEPVRKALEQGTCVILVIDVQGGIQVREKVPSALLIFVRAPGLDVLEQRLRARGTDDEASIQRRLANARRELELAKCYDVHLVNDDLERSVDELAAILVQNHCGGRIDHDR
ncbi:MAG: guanylate kinase [Isosphaeraceae bacterium]